MKGAFVLSGLLAGTLAMATPTEAATNVTGNIVNQHWTLAGSPYTMTGDVTVPAGSTLTIDAGVQVLASSTDDQASGLDTTRVELTIKGSLFVNGTAASPVVFTLTPGGTTSWYGIEAAAGAATVAIAHAEISLSEFGVQSHMTGLSIANSHIFHVSATAVDVSDGTAVLDANLIDGAGVARDVEIHGNTTAATVTNNVLYGCGAECVATYPTAFSTIKVVNNTILPAGSAFGVFLAANSVTGAAYNASVVNNIIVAGSGPGAVGVHSTMSVGSTITLTNNDVFAVTPYTGSLPAPVASLNVDPLFVSAQDFHLTSASPAIDAGTSVGAPTHDLDGNARPIGSAPDMGAYEFLAPIAPPTANAGPDQTVAAGSGGTAPVTLSGIATGTGITVQWLEGATALATTAAFTRTFATGVHVLTFTVTDSLNRVASDTMILTIVSSVSGVPGPPGPQGNSVAMISASTAQCATGGVQLQIVDGSGNPIGSPQFICNGAPGADGAPGATGPQGPPGPAATVMPGTMLFLAAGSPAPVGYRFVGSTKQAIPGAGQITMDVYVKQ